QLLAFGSDRLTVERVHQMLGTAHDARVSELAAAVLAHDPKKALDLLTDSVRDGLQLGEFLDQFLDYWRDLMVAICAGIEGQEFSVSPRERLALLRQAKSIQLDTILAGLEILTTAKARLRGSTHSRVLIEMALIRLCRLEDLIAISDLVKQLGTPQTS